MDLAKRLAIIHQRVNQACQRSGRLTTSVEILAVTKNQTAATMLEAQAAGVRLFGENRVQEAQAKFQSSSADFRLHLIGSLQRNKVKRAIELFDCIESVDRPELITELAKWARQLGKKQDILLELQTGEASKAGFPDEDRLFQGVELALTEPWLCIRGLMTMAPYTRDQKLIRLAFRRLARCRELAMARFPETDWSTLSMGMTNDFEIAIEEGSTQLRLGTAIFGERP